MQNEPIEDLVTKRFKFTKKQIILGLSAAAAALIIILMLTAKDSSTEGQAASSVVAVNQVEDGNPNPTDGYKITSGANASAQQNSPAVQAPDNVSAQAGLQPTPAVTGMSDQLNQISTQLQAIQDDLGTGDTNNIKEIKSELNSVIDQTKELITQFSNNFTQQFTNFSTTMGSQFAGMKDQLNVIQQLSQPGNYIDQSNLPFSVQNIDNVSGQAVVTVSYNKLLTPISVGESLAGWTLISADYASQCAVFQNSKAQLVKAGNNAITQGAQ